VYVYEADNIVEKDKTIDIHRGTTL